jgi:hypothetical protein
MNDKTLKALDRALDKLERASNRQQRRGRPSTAPIVLAIGLVLGYQLLVRLVPKVWASLLPGGLDQAAQFRGWPGLVARLSVTCQQNFTATIAVGAGIVIAAYLWGRWVRPLRFLVWLAALAVIVLDAGIIYVTLRSSMEATFEGAGIG